MAPATKCKCSLYCNALLVPDQRATLSGESHLTFPLRITKWKANGCKASASEWSNRTTKRSGSDRYLFAIRRAMKSGCFSVTRPSIAKLLYGLLYDAGERFET